MLLGNLQTQATVILVGNIVFLCFFGCYKPAKSPLTNKIVVFLECGLMILMGLFIAYDKTIDKNVDTQLGYSIAMLVVEGIMFLVAIVWSFYRLVLVIR